MIKSKKVLIILIIFILSVITIPQIVLGTTPVEMFSSQIKVSGTAAEEVKDVGGKVVGMVQVIGTMVSVGMLGVLGVKYSLGSAEERAEYKKTLFPYFIGSILIFGASNLTQVIYKWTSQL